MTKTPKITEEIRELAKRFAVAYAGYVHAADDLDIVVWAPILLDAQAKLGLTLANPETANRLLDRARAARKAEGL